MSEGPPLKKRKSRFGAKATVAETAGEEERKRKAALEVAAKLGSIIAPGFRGPPAMQAMPPPRGGMGGGGPMGGMMGGQPFRIMVPSEKVGVIIGKGGSKIREIQDVTGASLQVARESDPATPHLREVTIRGQKDMVDRAKQMVFDTIQQHDTRNGYGSMDVPAGQGIAKTIQVPSGYVGMLIGKGGETIRRLMTEANCHIHVEREGQQTMPGAEKPQPGHQNVYLKGAQESVDTAERQINDLLESARSANANRNRNFGQQQGGYGHQQPAAAYGHQQQAAAYGHQQQAWGYHQQQAAAYPGYPPQAAYGQAAAYAQPQYPAYGAQQQYSAYPPQYGQQAAYDPYQAGAQAAVPQQAPPPQQGGQVPVQPGAPPPAQPAQQPPPGGAPMAPPPQQQQPPQIPPGTQ